MSRPTKHLQSEKSLQELFLESRGEPVLLAGQKVSLMDRLPIRRAVVRVEFLGNHSVRDRGIAFNTKSGWIELSNGERVRLLHIWDSEGLPRKIEHLVNCPNGELMIWNIYRTKHTNGLVTVDAWTGNAGMIVKPSNENYREYACSSGPGDFDPSELLVRISWMDGPPLKS